MRPISLRLVSGVFFTLIAFAADPPKTWVDPDTGHRVIRLTDEPGSASLYFNQNSYSPDGKEMVYTTPNGVSVLNLQSRESRSVVEGRVRTVELGKRTRSVYYVKAGAVFSTNIDDRTTREIAKLPPRGSVTTVNADETMIAGTYIEGSGVDYNQAQRPAAEQQHPLEQPRNKGQMMEERLAAHLPMRLFVIDIKTGATRTVLKSTDWLNHLLFSPTDPTLLMYCHEGPWHKVDRIWTIRTDGTRNTLVHKRTMLMEIAGHEFWAKDGQTIWYDLQTPRGEDFWVAGYNVETGQRTWYHLQRNEWSIHFNVAKDARLFCGDGGDPGQVAHAPDGEWIYLFRPEMVANRGASEDKSLIRPGSFRAERLVNMSKHNYRLEPNVSFSPDETMIIFRSNMFGPTYVFGVEISKSSAASPSE